MKTQTRHKLTVGLTLVAAAISVAALPVISDAAANGRNAAEWTERAHSFEASQSVSLTDDLAAELTMLHAGAAPLTTSQRDAAQIHGVKTLDMGQLDAARVAAEQKQCMSEAIYYEARSETFSGQKAVGEVVMNRAASKHFPNSVCGVVYQGSTRTTGCQFSFTCDGSLNIAPKGKAWERSQTLAEHMLIGVHKPLTRRATHYHTTSINPKWASSVKPTRTIGSHKFYKFKSRRELRMAETSVAP